MAHAYTTTDKQMHILIIGDKAAEFACCIAEASSLGRRKETDLKKLKLLWVYIDLLNSSCAELTETKLVEVYTIVERLLDITLPPAETYFP